MTRAAVEAPGPVPRAAHRVHPAMPALTALVGLTAAIPAGMHLVAVTVVAYTQRGGYDSRLAQLLVIGTAVLVLGLVILGTLPGQRRGDRRALRRAALAAGLYALVSAVMTPVDPPFAIGVGIFGGYAALAGWLSTRRP